MSDAKASMELTTLLSGKTFKDVVFCSGDDDHGPHITFTFDGYKLHVMLDGEGDLFVGLQRPGEENKFDAHDLHEPTGAVQ